MTTCLSSASTGTTRRSQLTAAVYNQISLVPYMLELIKGLEVVSFTGETLSIPHNVLLDEPDDRRQLEMPRIASIKPLPNASD